MHQAIRRIRRRPAAITSGSRCRTPASAPATAARIGLVEEVVGKGESLQRALALAEQVGEQSPTSIALAKRLVHSGRDTVLAAGLAGERELFVELFATQDQREGVNAFLEKRKPVWKNC